MEQQQAHFARLDSEVFDDGTRKARGILAGWQMLIYRTSLEQYPLWTVTAT